MPRETCQLSGFWKGDPHWQLLPGEAPPQEFRTPSSQRFCITQLGALSDPRLLFSSRRSDGQNQRFPQALDLSPGGLGPSRTASPYLKVSVPCPSSTPDLGASPRRYQGAALHVQGLSPQGTPLPCLDTPRDSPA